MPALNFEHFPVQATDPRCVEAARLILTVFEDEREPSVSDIDNYLSNRKGMRFIVLGNASGMITAALLEHNVHGDMTLLHELATRENAQNEGYGTLVMREGVAPAALAAGDEVIRLEAEARAVRFYQRLGYIPEGLGETVMSAFVSNLMEQYEQY